MPDFARRGLEIDLKHVFISPITHEIFDPVNPTVEIVHYVGATEIVDLPETSMLRIKEGHYTYAWTVPNSFPEDETAFVYFRGTDENTVRALSQQAIRVLAPEFFAGGAGVSGLIIKFTKD